MGVIHRDIKPSNILMKINGDIVLADFGLACIFQGELLDEYCGTEGYMAPEIVLQQKYYFDVDIWSAGVAMYECLTKKQPFNDFDQNKLKDIFKEWQDNEIQNTITFRQAGVIRTILGV